MEAAIEAVSNRIAQLLRAILEIFSDESCPTGSSSISGLAFNPPGNPLPAEFDDALFFADYARVYLGDGAHQPGARGSSTGSAAALQTWTGVDGATFGAPDHEYPSYLELTLSATDSGGLSDTRTIRLDPRTVALSFSSNASGLFLSVNGSTSTTPFARTVIEGSVNDLAAPKPQTLPSGTYDFTSWSDGGARVHNVKANAHGGYTATYTKR